MFYCNSNFQLQSVLLSCGYNCSNMDVCIYSVCIYCIDISCPPEHTPQILDASPGLSPSLHPPFIRSQRKWASLPCASIPRYSILNTFNTTKRSISPYPELNTSVSSTQNLNAPVLQPTMHLSILV